MIKERVMYVITCMNRLSSHVINSIKPRVLPDLRGEKEFISMNKKVILGIAILTLDITLDCFAIAKLARRIK